MQSKPIKRDPNQIFFKSLTDKQSQLDRDIINADIMQRVRSVFTKLQELSKEEREEWQSIQLNKLNQLLVRLQLDKSKGTSKALREGLRCFVLSSCRIGIAYDRKEVERITKATYSQLYGKKATSLLRNAGYSTHDMEDLHYEEPASWKFLCCCSLFCSQ